MQRDRWPVLLGCLASGENHSGGNRRWHLKDDKDVFPDSTNKYIQGVSYERLFVLWQYCSQVTVAIALYHLFTVLLYFMGPLVLRIIVRTQVSGDHTSLHCCLFVLIPDVTTLRLTDLRMQAAFWNAKRTLFLTPHMFNSKLPEEVTITFWTNFITCIYWRYK